MNSRMMDAWAKTPSDMRAVLCSVVQWKGSIPRKDYPLMLVLENGSLLGTIGGGSMEMKVSQAALAMMGQDEIQLFDFDMTGSDVTADIGLCGGSLKVLVEPFSFRLEHFFSDLNDALLKKTKSMVLLQIKRHPLLSTTRKLIQKTHDLPQLDGKLNPKLRSAFEGQRTMVMDDRDQITLLWQPFSAPDLHIFGAGHVGQAVAHLAHYNEIGVHIYDDRPGLMTPQRFPHAERVPTQFPLDWTTLPPIPSSDLILIASREHRHDKELLSGLLKIDRFYLGLVSSARKWALLRKALATEGIPQKRLEQVLAPVGLDIQAQTIPEIAVSIISQMIAVYRGDTE